LYNRYSTFKIQHSTLSYVFRLVPKLAFQRNMPCRGVLWLSECCVQEKTNGSTDMTGEHIANE